MITPDIPVLRVAVAVGFGLFFSLKSAKEVKQLNDNKKLKVLKQLEIIAALAVGLLMAHISTTPLKNVNVYIMISTALLTFYVAYVEDRFSEWEKRL